jgi:hypothetical protein
MRGALPPNQDPGGGEMPGAKRWFLFFRQGERMVAVFGGHSWAISWGINGHHLA